jgi:hypothetical protein
MDGVRDLNVRNLNRRPTQDENRGYLARFLTARPLLKGAAMKTAAALLLGASAALFSATAAAAPQLQYVYGGSAGTVLFIHGKSDCSSGMGDCNGGNATSGVGPNRYWTNAGNGATMLNEATTKYTSTGTLYYEAFSIGYDLANQGYWSSANEVGACIQDFYQGTNNSGCNRIDPNTGNYYQRSMFRVVTHSAGATVMDRLLSTGWYGINQHIIGGVAALSPALAGSRASSALYGMDGYSNFCTSLVSWLAGWAFKNNGAQSLTRSAVIGEANKGYAGKSTVRFNKVVTTGGSCSANNNSFWCGTSVSESDNDGNMGSLASCLGYSSSDDTDGLLYWSDEDPTAYTTTTTTDPNYRGCVNGHCKYYAQFTGDYRHWFESWANHSHTRDDAYVTKGDWQSTSGCYTRSPGTCVGQYAW